ncbi:SusC/RagA family TonB-linked outer membrane protein [Chishuiella sp.]|uniref:SusC/RagA family TonB-linked outer membrane protein n=1 Tax=Chishuiella sp. TaxID=1969467 RepID=UPI0028AD9E3C|nr:SusC/RagA family TonB-linked outer membrane protein [Chishuiella sp.]
MKRNLLLLSILLSTSNYTYSQELDLISGLIQGVDKEPLKEIVITNLSTNENVKTDLEGRFSIKANKNDTLVIEGINYQTIELVISNNLNYELTLFKENDNELNEVVVTALGITKEQKKIGYATQEIGTETIEKITTPNVGNLFSGQVAGLYVSNPPGMQQAPKFNLRGKVPVIVIDGIIVGEDAFNALNQNDIENINVLKGISASALYGSRGKDGVVIITTKQAKKGGVSIELSQNIMYTAGFTVYPKTQKQYGNGSNGKYEFWDGADGGISDGDMIWGPKLNQGQLIAQWNSPIRNKVTGDIIPWYGSVSGTIYNDRSLYERVPLPWEYHDNLKNFLKTGAISNTNFAVNLNSEKGSLRLSGNYLDLKDRIPGSKLNKGGISLNGTINITDQLKLNSKIAYNRSYSPNVPNYGYNPSGHMYTVLIWMGNDVNGNDLRNHQWVPGMEGYRQANWNYAWYNNPWFSASNYKNERLAEVINSQIGLEFKATDNLSFKTNVSLIKENEQLEMKSPKSFFNYNAPREGRYSITKNDDVLVDYDFLASYKDKLFDDKIEYVINAGGAINYWKTDNLYSETDGLIVPGIYNLGNSEGNVLSRGRSQERLIQSLFATIDLSFYNALFINASLRNDWNSTLPSNNRSYFYPSISSSLVLSNFIKLPSFIDLLKIYGSWAQVSGGLDPYSLKNYYKTGELNYNGNQTAYYPSLLANPTIKPETSQSIELGLNTNLFKNRIDFGFTYYRVKDYNQIVELPTSETSGFEKRYVNGNEYTTNGFEVTLGLTPIKNSNFLWKSQINWSKYEKKLTQIFNNQERYGNLKLNDRSDSYYDYQWLKNSEGEVILDPNTGMPTRDAYVKNIGHLNPNWTFGFNNTFKYKNWNLDIGIDGSIGGVMRSEVIEKMWWGGKHPNSVQYRDQEYQGNGYVYIPNGVNVTGGAVQYDVYGNVISDTRTYTKHSKAISWQSWAQNYPYRARVTESESKEFANVFDRTFIKLRSVVLSYDFSPLLKNSKSFKGLVVNVSGYNLAIWKKAKGLYSDPDYNNSGSNDIQDPSSRWIGMGVNLKF